MYACSVFSVFVTNSDMKGYIATVRAVQPLGELRGSLIRSGTYPNTAGALRHDERYVLLLELVAAERAAYPEEFRLLEFRIFEIAEYRASAVYVPIASPHPFSPGEVGIDWEELVPGDGRSWMAYL